MENDLRWNNNNSWTPQVHEVIGTEIRFLSPELFDEYIARDEQGRQVFYKSLTSVPCFVFDWQEVQHELDAIEEDEPRDYVEYKKIVSNAVIERVYQRVFDFCISNKTELLHKQVSSLYRVARLFMHLNYLLERVQKAIS